MMAERKAESYQVGYCRAALPIRLSQASCGTLAVMSVEFFTRSFAAAAVLHAPRHHGVVNEAV